MLATAGCSLTRERPGKCRASCSCTGSTTRSWFPSPWPAYWPCISFDTLACVQHGHRTLLCSLRPLPCRNPGRCLGSCFPERSAGAFCLMLSFGLFFAYAVHCPCRHRLGTWLSPPLLVLRSLGRFPVLEIEVPILSLLSSFFVSGSPNFPWAVCLFSDTAIRQASE